MKERPIIFSAPMVRALLSGTKTQTRRVCKPAANLSAVVEVPDPLERGQVYNGSHFGDEDGEVQFACPYGQPGDRLWVRETFGHFERNQHFKPGCNVYYRADGNCLELEPWRPSIHMPRWASRINLEITSVRLERAQDISDADCIAEGCGALPAAIDCPMTNAPGETIPRAMFRALWQSINGPASWDANPWVWAITFKRLP